MHSNYLLSVLLSLFLSVIVNSDGHIDFEFLKQFNGLRWDSGTTESCVYDPINGLWRIWDRNMNGEADSISGNYPFNNEADFMQGIEGAGNETSGGVAGTVFVSNDAGNFVYVADIETGEIYQYNVDTEELGEELDTGYGFGANGLCYDEENNMLYATNVGIDFFVTGLPIANRSNIVRFPLDDAMPTPETIYISGDALYDSDGEIVKEKYELYINITGDNYTFRPNGCTIKDGMAYFVETRTDGLGGFLVYDIAGGQFVLNTATPGYPGDGLVTIGNYLIMSSWGNGSDTGFLSYYDLDSYPDGIFTELVDETSSTKLSSPADIGIDPYGTICIPSLEEGNIYFYKFSAPGAGYKILDKEFDFEEAAGLSAGTNSIAYDSVNDAYVFINNFVIVTFIPDVHEISALSTLDTTNDDFGYETFKFLSNASSVIDASAYDETSALYYGLAITDQRLFLVDGYGLFVEGDLDTKRVINFVELWPEGDSHGDESLRGVCNDPDNTNMFYVTSIAGNVYSIDISNDTVKLDNEGYLEENNWEVNMIYNGAEIKDQNDDNAKIYYPFDCTVADGKIYFVEYQSSEAFVSNPGLGIYDIDTQEFIYNTDLLSYPALAISSVGSTLVVGLFDEVAVLVSTQNDDKPRSPFQMIAGDAFDTIDNIYKVAVDYKNGVIVVNGGTHFAFIQSDDLILDDQDITTSTPEPEKQSTESSMVIVSSEESEDDTTDSTNIPSIIFSIIFVLIFYLF